MTQFNSRVKTDYNSELSVFHTISKFIPDQQTLYNFSLSNKLLYTNSISSLYKAPKITKLSNLTHFNEVLIGSKSLYTDIHPQLNLFVKELDLSLIDETIPLGLVNQLLYNTNLLKWIDLKGCQINSRTLQLISNLHGDSLIGLNLSYCTTVDADTWHQFRFNMKHLKTLKLKGTTIGDSELLNLILLCKDSLDELDLEGCERLTDYSKQFLENLLPNIKNLKLPEKFGYSYRDPAPFFNYIEQQIVKDHKHFRLISLYDYYYNKPQNITLFHHIQYNPKFFKNLLNFRGINIAIVKELRLISLKLSQTKLTQNLNTNPTPKKEDRDYPEFNLKGLRWNLPKELINNQSNTPGYILLSKILWAHWNPSYLPKVPLPPPSNQPKTSAKAAIRVTKPILGRYPVAGGLYNTQPVQKLAQQTPQKSATSTLTSAPPSVLPTGSFQQKPNLPKPMTKSQINYYNEINESLQYESDEDDDEAIRLAHSTWKSLQKLGNNREELRRFVEVYNQGDISGVSEFEVEFE